MNTPTFSYLIFKISPKEIFRIFSKGQEKQTHFHWPQSTSFEQHSPDSQRREAQYHLSPDLHGSGEVIKECGCSWMSEYTFNTMSSQNFSGRPQRIIYFLGESHHITFLFRIYQKYLAARKTIKNDFCNLAASEYLLFLKCSAIFLSASLTGPDRLLPGLRTTFLLTSKSSSLFSPLATILPSLLSRGCCLLNVSFLPSFLQCVLTKCLDVIKASSTLAIQINMV